MSGRRPRRSPQCRPPRAESARRWRRADGAGAHAARPAPAPRPAGRADSRPRRQDDQRRARPAARPRRPRPRRRPRPQAATRDADDTSPLLTRRAWMGLAWGAFSAASAAALARHRPLHVPQRPQRAAAAVQGGLPERVRDRRRRAVEGEVRRLDWCGRPKTSSSTPAGFYSLSVTCTHLGLHAELPVGGKQVQVPVPRQRLPHDRRSTSRVRRRGRSSARASCWPTTGRSWSTRAGTSSTSSGSGPIRGVLESVSLESQVCSLGRKLIRVES